MSLSQKEADDGLMVGLEIHQQLSTGKLFCRCPSDIEEQVSGTFQRRLHATKSELGEVDQAALAETLKGLSFRYEMTPSTSCLIDADEEPPRPMNAAALDVALGVALRAQMSIVDEIHVMRKIVIDGSNTTGFQRTALIAGGGAVPMEDGSKLRLQSLCVEEDSARETAAGAAERSFRLDRLGIPLIEIATAPDIKSGQQAQAVAFRIGQLLRATRKVKRGLGTIRQDINISVDGGVRVELKGVQDLRAIPEVVEKEAARQRALNRAAKVLQERGASAKIGKSRPVDLTTELKASKAKIVRKALDQGGRVMGIRLADFASTLGESLSGAPGVRVLGPEFSQRARVLGLGGTIHNEEGDLVAKYGFTGDEVDALRKKLEVGPHDCFLVAAGPDAMLEKAMRSIGERAALAIKGTVSEVRGVNDDSTSRYLRPMPGAARMYPETDLPPVVVKRERLQRIEGALPALPEVRTHELERRTGLSPALIDQLAQTDNLDAFEEVAIDETQAGTASAQTIIATNAGVARLLLTDVAEALQSGKVSWAQMRPVIEQVRDLVRSEQLAKEALPAVFRAVALEGKPLAETVAALSSSDQEARAIIRALVLGKAKMVEEKGEAAHGALMGMAMKELRGKVDGKLIAQWVREEIDALRDPGQ